MKEKEPKQGGLRHTLNDIRADAIKEGIHPTLYDELIEEIEKQAKQRHP